MPQTKVVSESDERIVSDPTPLTTQALNTAIDSLHALMNVRFEAMDKAVELLQEYSNRTPTIGEISSLHGTQIIELEKRIDHKYIETTNDINHLRDLHDSRLGAIHEKFVITERIYVEHFLKIDQQLRDQISATAIALSAADKAIDKAVAKVELAAEKGYLQAQIEGLKDTFSTQIKSQNDAVSAALAAADKAAQRADTVNERRLEIINEFSTKSENVEKFVSVWNGIKAERERSDQQFLRVDQQFVQLEKLAAQLKITGDTAVAAALQAQKEAAGEQTKSSAAAISKSEAATGESIRQLQALLQTAISGLNTQVLDVKSRLDKGEGQGVGRGSATEDFRYERGVVREAQVDSRGMIFGIVGAVIGIAAVVLTIIIHFIK